MSIDHESLSVAKSPSTLKKWGGIALISFAVAMTPVAGYAADLKQGQCGTPESIVSMVEAEGQQRIAVANAYATDRFFAEAIYSNADGSKGYRLAADKPRGEKPTKVCVANVLKDIIVNDARQPGVPSWAKIGSDVATAEKACLKATHGGACGPHDRGLQKAEESSGERVMLQAQSIVSGNQAGPIFTITYNPTTQKGAVLESFSKDGTAFLGSILKDAQYTDVGYAMVGKKKIITASATPETETASILAQPVSLTTTLTAAP